MSDVIVDSILDTLKLLPFLFLLYLLIELLEHETAMGRPMRALSGRFAPLFGAAAGLVPMCGFSVMASKLYERKYLTVGTLLSVFIATNDEALFVLALSSLPWADKLLSILALLLGKLIFGAGVGYIADLIAKRNKTAAFEAPEPEHAEEHAGEPHVCEHKKESRLTLFVLSPLWHALKVALVLLLLNLGFGLLFYYVGEDRVVSFLQGAGFWFQPLFASLVGLIPNCASSVALAQVYALGGLSFGSLFGGLTANAGLGMVVLLRNGRALGRNLAVIGTVFLLGVLSGYAISGLLLLV